MDTDAEAFVSGECPTPSHQARCGQRRNAWGRRGSTSDTEPSGEVRATPQCVGIRTLLSLTYRNDFQEEE